MFKQQLVSAVTLSGVAGIVLAIGGCHSGPEQVEEHATHQDQAVHGGGGSPSGEEQATGEASSPAEDDQSGGSPSNDDQSPEGGSMGLAEVEVSSDSGTDTDTDTGTGTGTDTDTDTDTDTGSDTDGDRSAGVPEASVDVIEIEPVDVPEMSEAEGDAEADSQSPESQSPDSQSPDSQSPELGAVPELETFEPLPAGDFVLTFVADDPELRRTLLTRLAAGDGADSFEKALAAGTMERLRTAAERGEAYRTVRLHRVSLASDQVMPIESAVDGAEVLLAVDAPGAPRIVGSGNPGQAVWKGVRVFAAPSSRPLLLWDRLAGQDGWSGWFIVLTR
jgi:hypothetical protein